MPSQLVHHWNLLTFGLLDMITRAVLHRFDGLWFMYCCVLVNAFGLYIKVYSCEWQASGIGGKGVPCADAFIVCSGPEARLCSLISVIDSIRSLLSFPRVRLALSFVVPGNIDNRVLRWSFRLASSYVDRSLYTRLDAFPRAPTKFSKVQKN